MSGAAFPALRPSVPELGRLEITLQPEKAFYKDENGARANLVVLFVVRGERTPELSAALQRATQYGRQRKCVPIDCELVYDGSFEAVEDQRILEVVGSSRSEPDGLPELDPATMRGSVCYRLTKVSMRRDNAGFCLKLSLRGLNGVIGACVTESTLVLSKRRTLRREDRLPEQSARELVETMARQRNVEVEAHLSRTAPGSKTVLELLQGDARFTKVPEYPVLLKALPEAETQRTKPGKRALPTYAADALGDDRPPPLAYPLASPALAGAGAAADDAVDDDTPFSAREGRELSQLVHCLLAKVQNLEEAIQAMEQHRQPNGAAPAHGLAAGSAAANGRSLLSSFGSTHHLASLNSHHFGLSQLLSSFSRTSPGTADLPGHIDSHPTMSSLDILVNVSQGQDDGSGGGGGITSSTSTGGDSQSRSSSTSKRARSSTANETEHADCAPIDSSGINILPQTGDGASFPASFPLHSLASEANGSETEDEVDEASGGGRR
jgi:hypothetical protein